MKGGAIATTTGSPGILSGRDGLSIVERREQAVLRRKLAGAQGTARKEEEKKRRGEAIWAEHQAILDSPPPRPGPRIRRL